MQIANQLIRGASVRNARLILQVMVGFVMMPFIIDSIGNRMYGFWALVGAFIGYYGLLDFGISSATNRYVSRSIGQNDTDSISEIFNNSLLLFAGIGLVILLISAIAALLSNNFLSDESEITVVRILLLLMGAQAAIGFPVRAYQGVLAAYLRYDLFAFADIIRLLLANVLIFVYLSAGYGIVAIAVITFATGMLQSLLVIVFTTSVAKSLRPSLSLRNRQRIPELFSYGWKTLVIEFGDILKSRVDLFVVASFLGVNYVTIYAVAGRLIEYLTGIVISTLGVTRPVFSRYEGRGDYESIRRRFLQATRFSAVLGVFLGMTVIFYGQSFISRWMGPGFSDSYMILTILCLGYVVTYMQHPSVDLLYAISKHQYYAIFNNIEGFCNLGLSLVLVQFYGLKGVALGTAIPMIIFKLLLQPVYVCRAIGVPLGTYYLSGLGGPALKTAIPLSLFALIFKEYLSADYVRLVFIGVIQLIVFLPYAYFVILEPDTRSVIREYVGSAMRRSSAKGGDL
jgi:O-antigen/teichoic acid export membrane protein